METLNTASSRWSPALSLERHLSRKGMKRLRIIFGSLTMLSLLIALFAHTTSIPLNSGLWFGLFLLSAGLWFEQIMLSGYHNYFYYAGINSLLGREELRPWKITYDVAKIAQASPHDITKGFLEHPVGNMVALRAGYTAQDIQTFLSLPNRTLLPSSAIPLSRESIFTLIELGKYILQHDIDFSRHLEEKGLIPQYWYGALDWIVENHFDKKLSERWWGKDNLLNKKGLGQDWSYGHTPYLKKYTKSISSSSVFSVFSTLPEYAALKVDELSKTLIKEKAGNVILIGEAGVGKADIIIALELRIEHNKSIAGLQHKKIAVLDTERLLLDFEKTNELEQALIKILSEAKEAGNCILVIEKFGAFIASTSSRGMSVADILDTYLADPELQFIVTDTPGGYHTFIKPLGALTRRFGEVVIDIPNTESVVRILQQSCLATEKKHKVFFSYPSLTTITQAANRYITDGVLPDSALTLLVEVASKAEQNGITYINKEFIHQFVKEKTGIPMGAISEEERDVLLHLEDTLHQNVIGQDAAITAIGKTIRRARVGIQTSNRPMGSFLFLGPTGVGKTETAKTLAKVFFGSEQNMIRFDMSEYSNTDAVHRLIGGNGHSGTLVTSLQDHPYSIVLLDEFEKGSQGVHDLFLQILDEGVFTDSAGNKINARNTIIIATSNAGAELIYNTQQQRGVDESLNQAIIDFIVSQGIFRPELINRFDNTIIFEPLQEQQQSQVAVLMLQDLIKRMKQEGYTLTINQDVVAYLTEHGFDSNFGARAMRREIQDSVESVIANKIIAEALQPGASILLSRTDLETLVK